MHYSTSLIAAFAASCALAIPARIQPRTHSHDSSDHHHDAAAWDAGATKEFVIHDSCNATQATQIRKGLADAVTLAEHAKEHILRFSNSSAHYRKYFGDAPSGEAIGNYERIVNGDRGDALFRCDDPDGNCKQPEWGGHWRGSNATNETVICDLSYSTRRPLEQLCGFGYTVAGSESNTYWGSDLIHRLQHMPVYGEGYIEHFTEDYAGALEQAKTNATYATHDSDVLQYFALEVYAYDIAVPGVGCPGTVTEATSTAEAATASTTAHTHSAETPTPTATTPDAASSVVSIPPGCHTHAGGELHCT